MPTVIKTDGQWSSEGQFMAFASPWSVYSNPQLVEGRDYINTVAYNAGDLAQAKNIQLTWRWPSVRPTNVGVCGYDHVAWGNYDGGAVRTPVTPKQVSLIEDCTIGYQVDLAGDSRNFNGLGEFYLTKTEGNAADKAVEIGWFYNAPPETVAWTKTGQQLGTFTDRYNKAWTVSLMRSGVAGTFIVFIPPDGKLSTGNFDAKGALTFLLTAGVVSPYWWLNGVAIGIEPLINFGTAIVRNFRPTLK
jgi:hypothetical protein